MEQCEDIRYTIGMKNLYSLRKETFERLFGTAKENHGFRYTQMIGKAQMEMKVGLTFACMNLKKLGRKGLLKAFFRSKTHLFLLLFKTKRKMALGFESQCHFVYSLQPPLHQVVVCY